MPIYAYRCESCGHNQDVLQKLADPHLTICTQCNQPSFKRQLTAAGFQLKGSGWYVTDFRDAAKKPAPGSAAAGTDSGDKAAGAEKATPAAGSPSGAPAAAAPPSGSASPAPAASASPAAPPPKNQS